MSECESSDSEAMHIVEILNYVNGFRNANIGVSVGDCHTTSKIAAAMSYLTYRVIAAGRTKIKPVELTKSLNEKIKANLGLSNKVEMLLRRDGEYGSIITSKEHIYVNGVNIRTLLDDFGSVILTKVIGENLRIYDLCNSIETSHRSKRVLRIIEREATRTKDYNVGIMFKDAVQQLILSTKKSLLFVLKSLFVFIFLAFLDYWTASKASELLMCIVYLYNMIEI